ncbi:MAG: dihydroorotate dehydrogenase electron transfer subunit [Nitriliruptoraceae bacterium]
MSRLKGGVVEGRDEGPVRATCEVIVRRREGAYWLLSLAARDIAERAAPGQFVELAVGGPHTLLRRPFSIARVSRQGASAGTVDVVFDAHGPGTQWLTTLQVHDVVDVIGPLGTAFPLPQRKANCVLVGGGYGIAPLLFLAEALLRKGLRVDMINGAATADRILGTIEAKRLSASVVFTTDDGSYGTAGQVTDVLDEVIGTAAAGVVYACGPNPMLRAVSERCRELGVPVQVAVEERMGCGLGVCFTCVVPVRGRDGQVRNRRACLDGPVFNGARIDWDAWGIPGGADAPLDAADDDPPSSPVDDAVPGGAADDERSGPA